MINMLISKRDVVKLRLGGKDVYVLDITFFASSVLGSLFDPLTLGMDEVFNIPTARLGIDELLSPSIPKLRMDDIYNPLTTKLGMDENLHNKSLTVDCCLTNEFIHKCIKNLSTINNDINLAALLCQMRLCIPVSIDNVSNRYISSVRSIDESETSSVFCFPAFASKLMELHDGSPIKGTECHNY